MNAQCPVCQTANPPAALFCRNCGNTLAAANTDGKTMVMAQPPVRPLELSDDQMTSIMQRASKSFGNGPVGPMMSNNANPNQREHTVFDVDRSGSMSWLYSDNVTKQEAACRANISMVLNKERIDPYDEIALVTFQSKAKIVLGMSPIKTCKRQIISAIQSLEPDGGTDINAGLKAARDVFDWSRHDVVRRIVLLTDGQGGDPLATADDLKSRGVVIDVVGVGRSPSGVDEKLLKKVASVIEGERRYRFIKDQQTLVQHYTHLANKTDTSD